MNGPHGKIWHDAQYHICYPRLSLALGDSCVRGNKIPAWFFSCISSVHSSGDEPEIQDAMNDTTNNNPIQQLVVGGKNNQPVITPRYARKTCLNFRGALP